MPARLTALLLAAALSLTAGEIRRLSILHSNDLHARLLPDDKQQGGFAHLATLVRQQRDGCRHCLYLHAGDLVQGTPVSTLFKGTPVYEIANRLGFDAATLGNHEFDYGWQQVPEFLRKAKFPLLNANVAYDDGRPLAKPYVIRKMNGIRIAIIGLVMSDLVQGYITPQHAGPLRVSAIASVARQYAAEVREKADLNIVLAHIATADGSALLRDAPEIDVVVEGHTHIGRKEMERNGDRVAVGCRAYGVELCRLDLEVEIPGGRIVSAKWERFPVDAATIPAARDVQRQVDKWEKRVSEIVDVKIAEARRPMSRAEVTDLFSRAIREEMKTDLGHLNPGGIRDGLPAGPILARHIWNIMPFDNRMVTLKVNGSRLDRFPSHGIPIDPNRDYTIALSDFQMNNELERKRMGLDGVEFTTHNDLLLRDVLIEWVRKQGVLR